MKEKFKLMKTRPQVTEDEINAFMDFDSLLRLKLNTEARRRHLLKSFLVGGAGVIITAGLMFHFLPTNKNQISRGVTADTASFTSPALSSSSTPDSLPDDKTDVLTQKKQPELRRKDKRSVAPAPATSDAEAKSTEPSLRSVYVQAEPVDGYPALYQYFADHLVYPASALKDSIEGVVNVVFVIDPSGRATDITVENSLGTTLDEEAIRLVKTMPLWRSATYNGKPVRVKISLPITFSIQKSETRP